MDTDYTDMLDITDILNADPHSFLPVYQEDQVTTPIQSSFKYHQQQPHQVQQIATDLEDTDDEMAELKELDDFSNYLIDHPVTYDDTVNSSLHNDTSLMTTNSLYTHMNNHISFNDEIPTGFRTSTDTSIINSPANASIIDEQLLTEIDSLITTSSAPGTTIHVPPPRAAEELQTQLPKLAKKPSVKRLPPNISQSPTTKRVAKSPAKQKGMAQSAAVLATSTTSMKSLAELQRHESARAAARAVGGTNVNRAKSIYYTQNNNDQSKKSVNAKTKGRLLNSRSNPSFSQNRISPSKQVIRAHSQSQSHPTTQHSQSQIVFNSVFDAENTDLTSELMLLESPLRISKLKSAKVKPSSCSIYSSATANSVRTNLSNLSNGSNTSKNSASSKASSTFDMYTHLAESSDTLETIVSLSTNDSSSNQQHQPEIQFINNTKNQYINAKYQSPPPSSNNTLPILQPAYPQQQIIINFNQQIPPRASSTISTHSESSTTSLNGLAFASTPSPHPGNTRNSSMFTPPHLMLSTNNRTSSFASTTPDIELMNVNNNIAGSPLTPVTKTALKFEQLTTNTPPSNNNGRYRSGSIKYHHQMQTNNQLDDSAIPKLSVWKTSPPSSAPHHDINQHLKEFKINTNIHSSKLSDEVEAEKFMKTMRFTNTSNHNLLDIKPKVQNPVVKLAEELFDFDKVDESEEGVAQDDHTEDDTTIIVNNTHTFSIAPNNNNNNTAAHKRTISNASSSYPVITKTPIISNRKGRNSMHSIHSNASTNSTISNSSTQEDKDGKFSIDIKHTKSHTENKRSNSISHRASSPTKSVSTSHNNKSSKDAAFRNLITTFNKKEPECYKPKVYSNMMQGLVEFQVKVGAGGAKSSSSSSIATASAAKGNKVKH